MLAVGNQDATEMVVCGTCGEVRGPWRHVGDPAPPRYTQGCRCMPGDAEPWPRVDFQTMVELCYVCGAEALPSGSRWALFQCAECKAWVMDLNHRFGCCVIPIGRHSIMNGVFYSAERVRAGVSAQEFADEIMDFVEKHDGLLGWRRRQVLANLAACGLDGQAAVPLAEYLAACTALPVDKAAAFAGVCRQYGVRRAKG